MDTPTTAPTTQSPNHPIAQSPNAPAPNGSKPDANLLLKSRWSQYDRWLRPEYVGDTPFQLTITDITYEDGHLNGRAVKTLALHFSEVSNLLALSAVNQRALAALFGNALGNCIGKKITVQKTRTRFGRAFKYPLRILSAAPANGAAKSDEPIYEPILESEFADAVPEELSEEIE